MKDLFIVIIIGMIVFFLLGVVFQIIQRRRKPVAHFTCNICGERHCDCRKD